MNKSEFSARLKTDSVDSLLLSLTSKLDHLYDRIDNPPEPIIGHVRELMEDRIEVEHDISILATILTYNLTGV